MALGVSLCKDYVENGRRPCRVPIGTTIIEQVHVLDMQCVCLCVSLGVCVSLCWIKGMCHFLLLFLLLILQVVLPITLECRCINIARAFPSVFRAVS